MKKNYFLILLLLAMIPALNLKAQDIPSRPSPPRLVNDLAGILPPGQENILENKLLRFSDTTSNQITVVFVKSLNGYDPDMYAYEIGENWQVGQGKFDNGIVVLVKPKTGSEKGQAAIAVGYGLEGVIPDAIAKRIVENEMIPAFKQDNYFGGIDDATDVLMSLTAGEFSSDEYKRRTETSPLTGLIPIIIIGIIFILIRMGRARAYTMGRSGGAGTFWTALMLGSMMGGGRSGSGWSNFHSGGGNFGGGGGGGFGGFGGGSFGGGGASGSW